MKATINVGTVFEDASAIFMARILGVNGLAVKQADVTSIGLKVFDVFVDPAVPIIDTPVTVASVIFDTLQNDARWNVDSTGYNFLHIMPLTAFPNATRNSRVEYKFTLAVGEVVFVVFDLEVLGVLTS